MSDFRGPNSQSKALLPALLLAGLGAGCGLIAAGAAGTQNDPVPTGNIVSQGNLTGVNGRAVTGTVAIYQTQDTAGNCEYVVRLQNLSAPTDSGLQVIPIVDGAPVSPAFYVLRSPTGNENYYFTTATSACSATFAQVEISNPAILLQSAQNYGIATLTSI